MIDTNKTVVYLTIILLFAAQAMPVSGGSSTKRRGSTYRDGQIEIFSIESKRLESNTSGLIYYTIKSKVRNRATRPITVTFMLQAIDRSGYEVGEAFFYDKHIKKYDTVTISDRLVMQAHDYDNIWEWKVDELRVE